MGGNALRRAVEETRETCHAVILHLNPGNRHGQDFAPVFPVQKFPLCKRLKRHRYLIFCHGRNLLVTYPLNLASHPLQIGIERFQFSIAVFLGEHVVDVGLDNAVPPFCRQRDVALDLSATLRAPARHLCFHPSFTTGFLTAIWRDLSWMWFRRWILIRSMPHIAKRMVVASRLMWGPCAFCTGRQAPERGGGS
jgi:hypothetical protein